MAELKTKENEASVAGFLDKVDNEQKRKDCYEIMQMMENITKLPPKMWGGSMVGFGSYHYKYNSGHEGDTFLIGFSPRKAHMVLYIMLGASDQSALLAKLGKYKAGKGCLYINKLADVDKVVLKKLISECAAVLLKMYK